MNLLTEAQAREKWCPLVRVQMYQRNPVGDNAPVNRNGCDVYCMASRCMAWRWAGYKKVPSKIKNQDEAHGYCGAFGKP